MKKTCIFAFLWITFFGYAQDRTDTIHIAHYDLHLSVTDFATHHIEGYAELLVIPKIADIHQITLDLKALTVDSVSVNQIAVAYTHAGEKLYLTAPTYHLGDTLPIRVYYHGTPVHDATWGGFYFSGQYAFNMGVGFADTPHNYGRVWFPCLDFFTDKSTYTMHIRTESGKMAVCNGMLTDSTTLSDSTRIWTWQLNEPIPTYLASIAVGQYQLYADTFQGIDTLIPITVYAQPTSYSNVGASFIHLKQILRMYEQLFGPYRWPRIGYVLVNFNSGAMEHATNIAYPNAAVDGTTTNESLYAHELFHLWFGDLITCNRAEEMWINEGFATYAEALVDGLLHSTATTNAYLAHIQDLHDNTLQNLAKDDGGLYALDSVPQAVTYGSHSYDKGALVIHSLRNYMGDSLFFTSCRALLTHYAFDNVSSEELFDYFSQVSGQNMTDFYEAWVHQPGFLQFHIDSILSAEQNGHYLIYLHQKLYGGTHFAQQNKLDLTFVSATRTQTTIENIPFSGEYGVVEVNLPFTPMVAIVDINSKLSDAVIDRHFTLSATGSYPFSKLSCTLKADAVHDTAFVRIEHNYVAPDTPATLPTGLFRMSQNHYWRIAIAANSMPEGQLQFKYLCGSNQQIDHALMHNYEVENLKLLYRPNAATGWMIVPTTRSGSPYSGTLKTDFIASGEYCFAVGDPTANIAEQSQAIVSLFPNPTPNQTNIRLSTPANTRYKAFVLDSAGRTVQTITLQNGDNPINLNGLANGLYLIKIMGKRQTVQTLRLIKIGE